MVIMMGELGRREVGDRERIKFDLVRAVATKGVSEAAGRASEAAGRASEAVERASEAAGRASAAAGKKREETDYFPS